MIVKRVVKQDIRRVVAREASLFLPELVEDLMRILRRDWKRKAAYGIELPDADSWLLGRLKAIERELDRLGVKLADIREAKLRDYGEKWLWLVSAEFGSLKLKGTIELYSERRGFLDSQVILSLRVLDSVQDENILVVVTPRRQSPDAGRTVAKVPTRWGDAALTITYGPKRMVVHNHLLTSTLHNIGRKQEAF